MTALLLLMLAPQQMTIVSVDTPPTTSMAPTDTVQLILHLRATDANGNPKDYTLNSFEVMLTGSLGADTWKLVKAVKLYDESAGWNSLGAFDPATDSLVDTVQSPELSANTVRLDWNAGTFSAPTRQFRDCYVVLDVETALDAAVAPAFADGATVDVEFVTGSEIFSGTTPTLGYTPAIPDSAGERSIQVTASTYDVTAPAGVFTDFDFTLQIIAEDAYGNRDIGYGAGETADLTTSLGAITPVTMTGFSSGVASGSVQLNTAGTATITATDSDGMPAAISGASGSIAVVAERTWTGASVPPNDNWNDSTNWNPQAVPVNKPAVIATAGGNFNPRLNVNADVQSLTIDAGKSLNVNGFTLRVSGNLSVGAGATLTDGGSGTLIFDGSGAQSMSGAGATTLFNLQVGDAANSPTVTFSGAASNLTLGGRLEVFAGATANLSSTTQTVRGNLKLAGTATMTGSTVTMDGTAAQTIDPGSNALNHLAIGDGGGPASSVGIVNGAAESATLTIDGNLTVNAGDTFNGTNDTINLKGNWTGSGAFTSTGSTVNFNGTAVDQTVTAVAFNNVGVAKSSTKVTTTGVIAVAGTLTVTSGTINFGTALATHVVTGTTSVTGTLDCGRSAVRLAGAVTVNSGGRLQLIGDCTLQITSGVTVNSGGRFRALPEGADFPTVTSSDTVTPTYYAFTVNGDFEVTGMNFRYCNKSGLRLTNASDASVLNLSRIAFDLGEKGAYVQDVISGAPPVTYEWYEGVFLHITTNSPNTYSAGLISNGFGVPAGPDSGDPGKPDRMINIKCTENVGSAITMEMTAASGAGRGEDFDRDDANDAGEEVTWVNSTTWTGAVSQNWNVAGNWDNNEVPDGSLDAIIPGGLGSYPDLDLSPGPFDCVSFEIQNLASISLGAKTLTISGTFTVDPGSTFTTGTSTIVLDGNGDQTIDTAGKALFNFTIEQTTPGASVISLSSDLNIDGVASFVQGKLDLGDRKLFIANDLDISASNFTFQQSEPAEVVFDGSGNQDVTSKTGQYFHRFTVNKPGGTVFGRSSLDINGNVTLTAGSFDPSPTPATYTHTVGGNWTEGAGWGTFAPAAGTIKFDGTNTIDPQQIDLKAGSPSVFRHVEIANTGAGVSPQDNLTINGSFSITGTGTFNGGTARVYTIAGTWTRDVGATFSTGTCKVVFTGTVTVPGETFYDLEVQGAVTASGALTMTNAFTLNGTSFTPSSGGANLTHAVQGNWTETLGTFQPTEGTIRFTGGNAQTIRQIVGNRFYNLTIDKSASTVNMNAATPALDVNNDFTLTAGTFNSATVLTTMTVGGGWSRSGTFVSTGTTVRFDGSGAQSIPAETWNNLDVNKASGTATATGTQTVNSALTVTAGTFNLGAGFTHAVNLTPGNSVDVIGGTLDLGTSTLAPADDVRVQGAGVLAMNGTASARPILRMGANNLLDVAGTLRTTKLDASFRPRITTGVPGTDRFNMRIGGAVDIQGIELESLHGSGGTYNGMTFDTAATITSVRDLNFNFMLGTSSDFCVNLLIAAAATYSLVEVRFPSNASTTVRRSAGAGVTVDVAGYSPKGGGFDAPAREMDPTGVTDPGQIRWVGDNFWLGTAAGGNNNKWSRTNNWSLGHVPTNLENAVIEAGKPAYPLLSADSADPDIFSLEMRGGTLTIDTAATTFNVVSNVSITGGAITMTAGTLFVGGTWSRTGGTWTHTTAGTVNFDTGGGLLDSTDTFLNLTISAPSPGASLGTTANITVSNTGSFVIGAGAVFNGGGGTLRTGTWVNSGTFNANTGTVVLTNTMTMPDETFYNITIDGAAASVTIPASTLRTALGSVAIGADDTLTTGSSSVFQVGGDWTNNNVHSAATGAEVRLNGTGLQQIGASAFHHLNVTNASAAGVTSTGALNIDGNLTIDTGAKFDGTGDTWNVAGNWTSTAGTYVGGAGAKVVFDGTASVVAPGTSQFRDVDVTGTASLAAGTTFDINGNLDITGTGSFTISSQTVRLAGNLTRTGTLTATGSNFFFDGTVSQTSGSANFHNVTVTGTGTAVAISGVGSWTLTGALTVDAGASLNASSDALTVAGNVTLAGTYAKDSTSSLTMNGASIVQQLNPGANTLPALTVSTSGGAAFYTEFVDSDASPSAATVTIDGAVVISAGGRLNGSDDTVNVKGNWTNSGVYVVSTSTLNVFNGTTAQTISGATTFDALKILNSSVPGVSVANNLTVNDSLAVDQGVLNLGTGLTHTVGTASTVGTTSGTSGTLDLGTSQADFGADLTVRALGTLRLFATAGGAPTLRMANLTTLRVAGTVNSSLNGANVPLLTTSGIVGADRFGFEVTGTIELSGLTIESPNADGLKILAGATLQDIDDVRFLSPADPGVQLNLPFTSSYTVSPPAFNFTGCTFQAVNGAPSSTNANVSIAANGNAGVTVDITMLDSLGPGGTPIATAESMDVDDVTAPGLVNVEWFTRNKWTNGAGDNNWGTAGNWSESDVPDAGDSPRWEVLIDPAFLVNPGGPTLNVDGAVLGITINGLTMTEGPAAARTLRVAGDFIVTATGAFDPGDGTVILDGDNVQTIDPDGEAFFNLTVNNTAPDGTKVEWATPLDINGALTLTNGQIDPNGLTHAVAGSWTETVAVGVFFQDLSGTIVFNGGGNQTIAPSSLSYFNHVQIDKNLSGETVTMGANWLLQGNFTLTQGTFATGGFTCEVKGNWDDIGAGGALTNFNDSLGQVKFTGASPTIKTEADSSFFHLTIGVTGTASMVAGFGAPDINGAFALTGGTFDPAAYLVEVAGDWNDSGGTFTGGTGGVRFDGAGAQNVTPGGGNRFNNVEINKSAGTLTALAPFNIDGTFTLTGGTFAPGTFTHTVAGTWDSSNAGGTFAPTAGQITFDGGAASITSKAADNFYDVSISSTGTKTAASGLDIDRDFTIAAGTFDAGAFTHTVGRHYTGTGTLTAGASTFEFDGAGAQTINAEVFNNLTVNNGSLTDKVTLGGAVTAQTTAVNDGILRVDGLTLTQNNNLTVAAGARLELNGAAIVQMADTRVLTIAGTLATTGSTPAIQAAVGQTYPFKVSAGSTLNIQGLIVNRANTPVTDGAVTQAGIEIAGGAHTFTNLSNLQFQNLSFLAGPPYNAAIWIGAPPGLRSINFTAATFDGTCSVNVRSTSALDTINMGQSGGVNQGEPFDLDNGEATKGAVTPGNISWLRALTWNGSQLNQDWNDGANWTPDISPASPDNGDVCSIPTGQPNYPNLTAAITYLGFSINVAASASVTIGGAATLDLDGGVTIGAGGTLTQSGNLNVGGNFDNSLGSYTHSGGTLRFNGTGAQTVDIGGTTLQSVQISNTASPIVASSNWNIDGSLTLDALTTFNVSGRTINLAGNLLGSGAFTVDTLSTFIFDGAAQTAIGAAFNDVQLSGSAAVSLSPNGTWDLRDLDIPVGTSLNITDDTIQVSGTLTVAGTLTNGGASMVVFDGTGAQTVVGLAYNRLRIDKGGVSTATLGSSASAEDAAFITQVLNGTLDLDVYTLNVKGGFDVAAAASLVMPSGSRLETGNLKIINFDGSFTASGAAKPIITINSGGGRYTITLDGPFDVTALDVSAYDSTGVQITANASGTRFENVRFTNAVLGGRHLSVTHAGPLAINASGCFFDNTFFTTVPPSANVRVEDTVPAAANVSVLLEDRSDAENGLGRGEAKDEDVAGGEAEWLKANTELGGKIQGIPATAYDLGSGAQIGTYVVARDVNGLGTEDRVYILNADGEIDPAYGTPYISVPQGDGDIVDAVWWDTEGAQVFYFGTTAGKVYRVVNDTTLKTLTVSWIFSHASLTSVTSGCVSDGTNVYFGGLDGGTPRLYAVLISGPSLAWSTAGLGAQVVGRPKLVNGSTNPFAPPGTSLYFGTLLVGTAHVYRVDVATAPAIAANITAGKTADIVAEPAIELDRLVVGDLGGQMQRLSLINGSPFLEDDPSWPFASGSAIRGSAWRDTLGGYPDGNTNGLRIYYGDDAGRLNCVASAYAPLGAGEPLAVDPDGGGVVPAYPLTLEAAATCRGFPQYFAGVIYLSNSNGKVFVVDESERAVIKTYNFGAGIVLGDIGWDNGAFQYTVGGSNGRVYYFPESFDPTP